MAVDEKGLLGPFQMHQNGTRNEQSGKVEARDGHTTPFLKLCWLKQCDWSGRAFGPSK